MKAIFIICAPAIENTVMEALKACGAEHYTKFPYLLGEGGHSEPHLDSHVWPGSNVGILAVADEKTIAKITKKVKDLKKEYVKEGLKAFVMPVEEEI